MRKTDSNRAGYLLAVVLGMILGGIGVALATRAIPKVMSGMMQTMMAQMEEAGCDPAEM